MKILLAFFILFGLTLIVQAEPKSPPPNEFIQIASPDLRAQFTADWQVEAVADRDSMGYLVAANDRRYQKFWIIWKTHQYDKSHGGDHNESLRHVPPVEGYLYFERQELSELNEHNAPPASTQSASTILGPVQYAEGTIGFVIIGIGILLIIALYFLPSLIAVIRGIPQIMPTIIINIIFGWTLVGWVVAMCFACWGYQKRPSP